MIASETKSGRIHNAAGAREAILDAAEAVFAEHGFDGARMEAIARSSSYNSSLIFHYFGDKLNLYAEVIRRADREMTVLQTQVFTPLFENETILSNPQAFRAFLENISALYLDYLLNHPRFTRMLLWEQAEGWQTFSKIFTRFDTDNGEQIESIFRKAYRKGMLRSNFFPILQLSLILQICLSFIAFIPLYQIGVTSGGDAFSPAALDDAKKYLVSFVVHGMMADPTPQP